MSRLLYQLSYTAEDISQLPLATDGLRRADVRSLETEWLRRLDSNQRPSGYEPDELPLLHAARKRIPDHAAPPRSSLRDSKRSSDGR